MVDHSPTISDCAIMDRAVDLQNIYTIDNTNVFREYIECSILLCTLHKSAQVGWLPKSTWVLLPLLDILLEYYNGLQDALLRACQTQLIALTLTVPQRDLGDAIKPFPQRELLAGK